ncbi:MAG: RNA polymerase sigma factor [Adhaeribacter sp.]
MDTGKFLSEKELLIALRQGEPNAYENIYRKSLPTIISFVYLNSGQEEDARDLLQEALIVLFRKLQQPEFVLTCKVTTFIYAVCRNMWLHQLVKQGGVQPDINDIYPTKHLPENAAEEERDLLDKKLELAFKDLDAIGQQILIKYYFDNQSLEEIAHALNFPSANAVKVKKFRCIQKLKDALS